MTVASSTARTQYNGDGATVAFSTGFIFLANADVVVTHRDSAGTETEWTEGTQYSLTGAGTGSNGTVTVSTSPTDYTPASGETLTITREPAETQTTDIPAGGAFPAASVENALDRVVMLVQALRSTISRSVLLPVSTAQGSALTLPEPADNAGGILKFNAGGTDLETVAIGDISASSVTVPLSSTDNAVVRFNGTGGADFQNSGVTIDDNDSVTIPGNLKLDKGADVASANALTLGTDGNYFDITGTTSITSIGTLGVGTQVVLQFDGALTLTHHATDLVLFGSANITTAAGDHAMFVEYATGDWRCVGYWRASGLPAVLGTAQEWTAAQNFNQTALTSTSGAVAWNVAANQAALHVLTENTTFAAPSGLQAGMFFSVTITQHASAAKTVAWNAAFLGTITTMTTDTGKSMTFVFYSPNGTQAIFMGASGAVTLT